MKQKAEISFSDACGVDKGLGGRCHAAFETEAEADVSLLMPALEGYPGGGVALSRGGGGRRAEERRGAEKGA